jgi:hypothetical protein
MIGLLLILRLFAGLIGFPTGGGEELHTPAPGTLERVHVERSGGIAYQELRATIDDPEEVAALAELLPTPLPAIEQPTGTCADCWVYRVELTGSMDTIVMEFDQANEPLELAPFVDALDDALE